MSISDTLALKFDNPILFGSFFVSSFVFLYFYDDIVNWLSGVRAEKKGGDKERPKPETVYDEFSKASLSAIANSAAKAAEYAAMAARAAKDAALAAVEAGIPDAAAEAASVAEAANRLAQMAVVTAENASIEAVAKALLDAVALKKAERDFMKAKKVSNASDNNLNKHKNRLRN